MAPVTVAQLGALFSTSACVTSGDSPSRRVLPGYTQRHGWRISGHADFGDGGSFPELDVVQMPNGLGWDTKRFPNVTPLAALDCGFGELQAKAARCALRLDPARANAPRRGTPEYDTFVLFLRDTLEDFFSANQSPSPDAFADALVRRFMAKHPNAREGRRVTNTDPGIFGEIFLGSLDGTGEPVVVTDGGRDWTLSKSWTTLGGLKNGPLARRPAMCNDRAPARRADAVESPLRMPGADVHGTKQRTCELPFFEFLTYVEGRPGMDFDNDEKASREALQTLANADAPFYVNGWRAFEPELLGGEAGLLLSMKSAGCVDDTQKTPGDVPEKTPPNAPAAFPKPYFTSRIDATALIACEARRVVLGKLLPGRNHVPAATAAAEALDLSLQKLFIGPCGTVTRMHQDAGEAHGWLGQVLGRKLFILCPPSDAPFLCEINGEVETAQSSVDPLDMSEEAVSFRNALFWEKASPVITILKPSEVVLVPKGWWHYAAALDKSVTAMKNFYDAATNVEALVKIVAFGTNGTSAKPSGPTIRKQ